MAAIPYTRVAYLLGIPQRDLPTYMLPSWREPVTQTPTTLSGSPSSLSSYQLEIAFRDGDDWYIYCERNSQTTNRHITAARAVIESQGYRATDETKIIKRGWDRHAIYQRYRKPA